MSRRKGTPCACSDDCGCSSSKGKCIRALNNVSPDPNGDFNIKAGTGIAISDGPDNQITIINSANPNAFVEGDNIDLIPSGNDIEIALTQNPVINGTLTVNGDIIQNGAAYETHAEKVYSRDDYIIMRDGAIAALAPGDYSGFQVKLYDGVNDGRLVIDSSGVARVGDVGDEQPLMTRDESADLTNGDSLIWDAANSKTITAAIPSAIGTALAGKQDTLIELYSNFSQNLSNGVPVYDLGSITASKSGFMFLSISGAFANNSNGYRLIGYSRNSTSVQEAWIFNTNTNTDALYFCVTIIIPVTQGDVIRTSAYQTSGSTLGISGAMRAIVI